ncbi:E3 ubiquitin-protein ligase ZSWIM2 [Engraulis encrasicolus]|uniref:E3 ubiquitin-protein ligase ZSWIM2 n=1 Tax=Engraulis encrasicolus TaxID=184585 RepID=UPI002FCF01C4
MFRQTTQWRKTISDAISLHQEQALNTVIYILNECGPTGFQLKENGGVISFKVCLGDTHTCTCPTFQKEKELCKHICWILLRKFRLPRDHEYCYQLGLGERQIAEVLRGSLGVKTPRATTRDPLATTEEAQSQRSLAEEDGSLRQKEMEEDDVCPICQEEFFSKHLPVAHCRYGCGNSVHISCMKIWADHQPRSENDTKVKCPLCREDFGPAALLLEQARNACRLQTSSEKEPLNKHLGIICNNCRILPITGKCYKCATCKFYHLCEECMKMGAHVDHGFGVRLKRSQQWLLVHQCDLEGRKEHCEHQNVLVVKSEPVPEAVLSALPMVRVREGCRLLGAGMQCRICLRAFTIGQKARHLPCHHKFHRECIDPWLQQSNCCPLDGYAIYNPLTWACSTGVRVLPAVAVPTSMRARHSLHDPCNDLFVPGVRLKDRTTDAAAAPAPILRVDSSESACLALPKRLALGRPLPISAVVSASVRAADATQELSVNSVAIEYGARRTSDTELLTHASAHTPTRGGSRPGAGGALVRCRSVILAPITHQLVRGSGLSGSTAIRPNAQPLVPPPPPPALRISSRQKPSTRSRTMAGPHKAATQAPSGDTYAELYVGGSPLVSGGSSMGIGGGSPPGGVRVTPRSGAPRKFRPLRKSRSTLGPPGGVSEMTLWLDGVYLAGSNTQKN